MQSHVNGARQNLRLHCRIVKSRTRARMTVTLRYYGECIRFQRNYVRLGEGRVYNQNVAQRLYVCCRY